MPQRRLPKACSLAGGFQIAINFVFGIRTSLKAQRQGTRVSRRFVRKLSDRAIDIFGFR
jgi:hypothetical protein